MQVGQKIEIGKNLNYSKIEIGKKSKLVKNLNSKKLNWSKIEVAQKWKFVKNRK